MANTIIIGNIEASAVMIGNSAVSAVYIGSSKIYPSVPVDYSTQYLTFKVIKGGNITIKASNANVAKTIQYSTDNGSTWTSLTTSTTAQELGGALSVGDKILVKGTNTAYGTNSYYNSFGGTAKVNVYGNIMSLIYGDSFEKNKTLTDSYTFKRLFYSYANLLTADNLILPATTLASNCYNGMFYDCTSLTTSPELPATTLAGNCYAYMFSGTNVLPDCSNIDFTSNSVVSSGGLISLFAGTKVTDSDLDRLLPKNTNGKYYLPATTLAVSCYSYMFQNCRSLTTAPELPATTLTNYCYSYMFQGCTSLTTAPELPATTLASNCYNYMFQNCTALTTAPSVLPATTLTNYCYQNMFRGCTSLETAPELPATKLATYCYNSMFYGCTSLVTAPTLPATTLATYCYRYMFYSCSSLNYIKCLATDISATNCTSSWLKGVAASGTFVKNASMTSWTRGVNGIPTGWTVQNDGATTDNWVLVNNTFDKPRKIKVDYSLIEDDNSIIRNDYKLSFQAAPWTIVYLNEETIYNFVEQYGWDEELLMNNFLNMVGVVDDYGELAAILEDGVEYTQIGYTSITEMDYIQAIGTQDNHYLYATE